MTEMTALQFAEKYLGEHKLVGKEIKAKQCPFCGKEKWKFYVNTENGNFFCQSGSCNAGGSFLRLKHKFGLEVKFKESLSNKIRTETVLTITPEKQKEYVPMTAEMYKWWVDRGITKPTLDYMKVCSNKGNIVFPYLQESELKMMKHRDMVIGKEKKVWQVEGGTAVLWGLDKIDFTQPVILAEGEPDMLSWIEAGFKNVVSVPFGCGNLEWITNNFEYLQKIKEMYLCFDNDTAGRKATVSVRARLSEFINLKKINTGTYSDVNEVLKHEGKERLKELYEHAQEFKIDGYYYGENISVNTELPEATSFIKCFDKNSGGFKFGELVIWSAYTGSGKTTLLAQKSLKDIANGYNVCYYSGEDSKEDLITIMAMQLHGKEGCRQVYNKITDEKEYLPKVEVAEKMKKQLCRKLIIIEDEVILNDKELTSKIQSALTKDNCRIFILDNLMQIDIIKEDGDNKNDLQKKFVRGLVRFARKNNIQIHLVAHNKKPADNANSGKTYDVSGAAEIVNLAHMVIGVDKVTKKKKQEMIENGFEPCDAVLNILKKRKKQGKGEPTFLKFDTEFSVFSDVHSEFKEKIVFGSETSVFEGELVECEVPEMFEGMI